MTPFDALPTNICEQPAAQRRTIDAAESDRLFHRLFDVGRGNATDSATKMRVGEILNMVLPENWEAGTAKKSGAAIFNEVHAPEHYNVQINFSYRGNRVSDDGAASFRSVLYKDSPHDLSTLEISSLREVLGDQADPKRFATETAKTKDINGKRCLVVTGQYLTNPQKIERIYIDRDGSGSAVEELSYTAPKSDFQKYLQCWRQSADSIIWK